MPSLFLSLGHGKSTQVKTENCHLPNPNPTTERLIGRWERGFWEGGSEQRNKRFLTTKKCLSPPLWALPLPPHLPLFLTGGRRLRGTFKGDHLKRSGNRKFPIFRRWCVFLGDLHPFVSCRPGKNASGRRPLMKSGAVGGGLVVVWALRTQLRELEGWLQSLLDMFLSSNTHRLPA